MKKHLVIILIGVIVILGIVFGMNTDSRNNENSFDGMQNSEETLQAQVFEAPTTFSWHFEKAQALNLDGFPETDIFLEIEYINGSTKKLLVDTVDGGCSELIGEPYEGDISNTGRVQCYYAGFGQQYRITQDEETYFVERKLFEEIIPDIDSVPYTWEVLVHIL